MLEPLPRETDASADTFPIFAIIVPAVVATPSSAAVNSNPVTVPISSLKEIIASSGLITTSTAPYFATRPILTVFP